MVNQSFEGTRMTARPSTSRYTNGSLTKLREAMIERFSQDVIDISLKSLNDNSENSWEIREGKLYREFKFPSFVSAFGFMTQVAILAERANHHPQWSNVYNKVEIYLTTHEAKGISKRDFELAQEIGKLI